MPPTQNLQSDPFTAPYDLLTLLIISLIVFSCNTLINNYYQNRTTDLDTEDLEMLAMETDNLTVYDFRNIDQWLATGDVLRYPARRAPERPLDSPGWLPKYEFVECEPCDDVADVEPPRYENPPSYEADEVVE